MVPPASVGLMIHQNSGAASAEQERRYLLFLRVLGPEYSTSHKQCVQDRPAASSLWALHLLSTVSPGPGAPCLTIHPPPAAPRRGLYVLAWPRCQDTNPVRAGASGW